MLPIVTLVMAVIVAWPPAQHLFRLGPLHLDDLAICLAAVAVAIVGLEIGKPSWLGAHGRPRS
jgi:Ca2+-transporting ATPase